MKILKSGPRQRKLRIGVSTSHDEQVALHTPAWRMLTEVLTNLPVDLITISEPLQEAPLGALDALLIGAPTKPLSPVERKAVARWVQRGGRLLRLAARGSDLTDLPFFQDGLSPQEFLTAAPLLDDHPEQPVLKLRLSVDATGLLGRAGTLLYEEGLALRSRAYPHAELDANGAGRIWPRGRGILSSLRTLEAERLLSASGTVAHIGPHDDSTEKLRWMHHAPELVLMMQTRHGRGTVLSFGGARSFSDRVIGEADNLDVLQALLRAWLGDVYPRETHRRMAEPQRHRLLQGYPMAPLLPPAASPPDPPVSDRPLIVGVLPHPFCNPAVTGCGFCTFPHQAFKSAEASASAAATRAELEACFSAHPHLAERRLEAIYFGGGTANLTPVADFDALCGALAAHLDTSGAEVTLEGVPRYFLLKDGALLQQVAAHFPDAAPRISMGVQTFSPDRLSEMGREHFGTRDDIASVLATARGLGATASGDFLINLPGQSLAEMLADISMAIDLGFDQICLYHLVLFEGLGTEWSLDPEKLTALPPNPEAALSWLACRQALLEAGYTQTTLTNFEREPGFRYERSSFQPEVFDALGFGPGAISTLTDGNCATKWLSTGEASEYVARVTERGWFPERAFSYDSWDLRLLHLTRQLARLRIDRASYQERFSADVLDEFSAPLEALTGAGLLSTSSAALEPTPLGMFYADTIAGLLAWPRSVTHRGRQVLSGDSTPASELDLSRYERARSHHMG